MTIVKLECTATKCSAGSDGSRWTTPDLPPDTALRLLDLHRQDCHGASASSAVSGGGEGGVKKNDHLMDLGGSGTVGLADKTDRNKLKPGCESEPGRIKG